MNNLGPDGQESEQLLRRYGVDRATVEKMYHEWSEDKIPKSVLEARYLRTRRHHGKLFNRLVRNVLGKETQSTHKLALRVRVLEEENARLRKLVRDAGLDPGPPTGPERLEALGIFGADD